MLKNEKSLRYRREYSLHLLRRPFVFFSLGKILSHNVNSIINCEFQYYLVEGNLILEKIKECQKSFPLIEASVPMPKGVPCWHVLLQRGEGGEVKVASNYRIFHQWSSNLVAVQSVSLHLRWHGLLKIKLKFNSIQFNSNQIKSNQIKSNQIKSNQN